MSSAAAIECEARQDALPARLWKENLYRLVSISLWDMLERYAFGFYEVIVSIEDLRTCARLCAQDVPSRTVSNDEHVLEKLTASILEMKIECEKFDLTKTAAFCSIMDSEVKHKKELYTYAEMVHGLDILSVSFSRELNVHTCLRITTDKERYFQRTDLAGPQAVSELPSCSKEITNAGNCYALEQNEACVFHCMCALEAALHVLASELSVKFSGTLDLQNWQNIIENIEAEIRKLEKLPKGKYKAETLTFFSGAAMQFRWFKDAWRNHVMHGRDIYDPGKAYSIFDHVREFVRALAEGGLKE